MRYVCPVCGYPDLRAPPWESFKGQSLPSWDICSCCQIHFGYDDIGPSDPPSLHILWRRAWIRAGMVFWFEQKRPRDWDPITQLAGIGVTAEDIERIRLTDEEQR